MSQNPEDKTESTLNGMTAKDIDMYIETAKYNDTLCRDIIVHNHFNAVKDTDIEIERLKTFLRRLTPDIKYDEKIYNYTYFTFDSGICMIAQNLYRNRIDTSVQDSTFAREAYEFFCHCRQFVGQFSQMRPLTEIEFNIGLQLLKFLDALAATLTQLKEKAGNPQ